MTLPPLIAVVDDDDSLRVAIVGLVRSLGYRADGHATAEDFLGSSTLAEARCVITDLQMPGMGGIELKQAIDKHRPTVPVIMITARTEEALLDRARRCGPFCLLLKPFAEDDLISCLDRVLAV